MIDTMHRPAVRPPRPCYLALEQFSLLEYATCLAASPWLPERAGADGHGVLVLPGLGASDLSTTLLRRFIRDAGYRAHGWRLGTNIGPYPHVIIGMQQRLASLRREHGAKVSLIGWSLGGIYARELARSQPADVRQVITLASPFRLRSPDRSNASAVYRAIAPRDDPLTSMVAEEDRPPLPVPTTCIYTRTDGIVRWHTCIEEEGPNAENVEVFATHSGLGHNIAAWLVIADRLAQPESARRPFVPPASLRQFFPAPVTWRPGAGPGRR